ncbi:MAG: hypothetical protein UW41_C0006G0029 [Candidatus Collierbacteria bacterium GW2011_GWC2_44_18]|uniref:DUF4025 domain-containing protein n=1 Tax=Candidatus Collierbacteria bacterium GW2011_GWC2_44_18 TaxID=1618392 RepID=A0A0G1HQL9_9BACT|nr:MAG: hypothetical protein UW41_C0006G0029 [Candidatus Collierbacteria bacterium GW2011_GWC2_44_18]
MSDPKDRTQDIKDQEALKEGQSDERKAEIDNVIGGLEYAQQSDIANDLGEEMDD